MSSVADTENLYQVQTYKRFPFVVDRGEGNWIITDQGERYLDLYGGHAVVGTGHCHPTVVEAVRDQVGRLMFYSNLVHLPVRAAASEALVKSAPAGLDKVFFVNSGSEANDNAIKIVRKYTGRKGIISFEGGFHGRTAAAISATGIEKFRNAMNPRLPDHHFVPFADTAAVATLLEGGDIAGVLMEPVQSMAGVRTAPPEFYQEIKMLTEGAGALLIYDEVQTGMGRTGDWFFAGTHGVVPDVVTLGKAIASGVPMGAVLISDKVASTITYGDLGSTFGGGPVAAAALKATIDVIREEKLLERVQRCSARLKEGLVQHPAVKAVTGVGFLLGIVFEGPSAPWQKQLLEKRILTGGSNDPSVMRLLPPMTLTDEEVEYFLDTFLGLKGES